MGQWILKQTMDKTMDILLHANNVAQAAMFPSSFSRVEVNMITNNKSQVCLLDD